MAPLLSAPPSRKKTLPLAYSGAVEPEGTNLNLKTPKSIETVTSDPSTFEAEVQESWKKLCSSLSERERKKFESYACSNLQEYLNKLRTACKEQEEQSMFFKVLNWFEPMFKATELFIPVGNTASQAIPTPGPLILGGVVGVMSITSRLLRYQKRTLQMLARMGGKAEVLLEYKRDYKSDYHVQRALVLVLGDILKFCKKAFRFLTANDGHLRAKVKGLELIVFKDFKSQLGTEVENFEMHIEELEDKLRLCERRMLARVHENQEAHHKEFGKMIAESIQRQDVVLEKLSRQDLVLDKLSRQDNVLDKPSKRDPNLTEEERFKRNRDKERFLGWLSQLSFDEAYDLNCREHLKGTGSWFLESDGYKEWKHGENSDLLWVKGKPGCGKSVLAAVTITDLQLELDPNTSMAYAFCRRADESSQNPLNISASLARQIIQGQPDVTKVLGQDFLLFQKGDHPSENAIWKIMNISLSHFTKTFLVIDGLDECHNHMRLAQDLTELMQSKFDSCVKIIIFSRPDYDLDTCLQSYNYLQPDRGANQEDLESYISSLFPDHHQATVNQKIREECIQKADGMFLWVKLLWQNLRKPLRSKAKLRRIREIPPGLDNMYDGILKQIYSQDEDVMSTAFLVLIWVTHAKRPLNKLEMLAAVADYGGAMRVNESSRHGTADELVSACANLVFIDQDGNFRLCHESVRNYLDQVDPKTNPPLAEYQKQKTHADKLLAEICLTYLNMEDFDCGPVKSSRRLETLIDKFPFISYAARFWGAHIEEVAPELEEQIVKFVSAAPRRELSMQILLDDEYEEDLWTYPGTSNPLHILSFFGLKETAETFSNAKTLARELDGASKTPLLYALMGKQHDMAIWLIEQLQSPEGLILDSEQKSAAICLNASLNWADVLENLTADDEASKHSKPYPESLGEAFVVACRMGHTETVSILIRQEVDINLTDEDGSTPLIEAIASGHTSVVELLLNSGADPNRPDSNGFFPLHLAARYGKNDMVRALLDKKADVLKKTLFNNHFLPIHIAAEEDEVEIVRTLHQAKPQLNVRTKHGFTPMHVAAWNKSIKTAQALLDLGAPKDVLTVDKETALYVAADKSSTEVVKLLVEAGCNVNSKDVDGETALHAACKSGKLVSVRSIITSQPPDSWKILVNVQRKYGHTPLHFAVEAGNAKIVKFLLEAGADGTIKGNGDATPLHDAARLGHSAIASLLLNQTKDANPRNENDETPLHLAASGNHIDFFPKYFQRCAELGLKIEINAENSAQKNLLIAALDRDPGSEEVAMFLLKKGAICAPDKWKNYPIHLAAWDGLDMLVEALLDKEGVTMQGYFGRTPINCAAHQGQLKALKLLEPQSKEILNISDEDDKTPVFNALEHHHLDVANYLLDIQVDHNVIDTNGNSLLHLAAGHGELSMVQRLLDLGCKGDVVNKRGETPLFEAVRADSIDVVDALITAGFNTVSLVNHVGFCCSHFAADLGNLEMLQKLIDHGAPAGLRNQFGGTPAHLAASNGHIEILTFLKNIGEDLSVADREGVRPILRATFRGQVETLKYLLKTESPMVNEVCLTGQESLLTVAAYEGLPLTIECLLAAGADPYHRDSCGFSALDFASRHHPSLRVMHGAGHVYDADGLKNQREILYKTVRRLCESMIPVADSSPIAEIYDRSWQMFYLFRSLIALKDFDAAKVCCMELHGANKPLGLPYYCEICQASSFTSDEYICMSCYSIKELCKNCYDDFIDDEDEALEGLEEILALEKLVQPVREAVTDDLPLSFVGHAMIYFNTGKLWLSDTLEKYESWESEYNSSGHYRELERPGQEFLVLVKSWLDIHVKLSRYSVVDAEDQKKLSEQSEKYKKHRRKHRPDKEMKDFQCRGHPFFAVTNEEMHAMTAKEEDLDKSGRMTLKFLQHIREKYSGINGIQSDDTDANGNTSTTLLSQSVGTFGVKIADSITAVEEAKKQDMFHPTKLKRAQTSPPPKPMRSSQGEHSTSTTDFGNVASGQIKAHLDRNPKSPGGVQTMPLQTTSLANTETRSFEIEMKDTRTLVLAKTRSTPDVLNRLSTSSTSSLQQKTVKKIVNVTFGTKSKPFGENSVSTIGNSILGLNLSPEPDSIAETQIAGDYGLIKSIGSSISTGVMDSNGEGKIEDVEGAMRIAYLMVHEDDDDKDRKLWFHALSITEAMQPGFIEEYFQEKKEEREEAQHNRDSDDETTRMTEVLNTRRRRTMMIRTRTMRTKTG